MNRTDLKAWLERMSQQKMFSASLIVFTLALGVVLGTLLTTRVSAALGQSGGNDATPIAIPPVKKLSNDFTRLAQMLDPSVVYITTDYTPKAATSSKNKRRQTPQPQQEDDEDDNGMTNPFHQFFGSPFGQEAPRKRESSGSGSSWTATATS